METGIKADNIYIPTHCDLTKFSCIACDQFTSEPSYWVKLKEMVGNNPSSVNLILPEAFLSQDNTQDILAINKNIEDYLNNGVFLRLEKGFVLTIRTTPYVKRRLGLIGAIDLEKYEFGNKTNSLVRSTEGVVEERIPPRLKIRKDAKMEFPHIMVLFDDEKKEIIEKLYENRNEYKKIYDFELNMGGGHLEGYFIPESQEIYRAFENLLDSDRLIKKYGIDTKFAFAVGDGNHSLATAKAHWNNIKKEQNVVDHPARYALCEFNNIYDDGIYFEPIYRYVVLNNEKDKTQLIKKLLDEKLNIEIFDGEKYIGKAVDDDLPKTITLSDKIIKNYIQQNGGDVDYVHGKDNLVSLISEHNFSIGILFDTLKKEYLFKHVANFGSFPKKTFSMGEGKEKRYYLEGRIIKND